MGSEHQSKVQLKSIQIEKIVIFSNFLPTIEVDKQVCTAKTSEDIMNTTVNEYQAVVESIQRSNDLLKMITAARFGIDEKMVKANVVANVIAGIGEHVDIEA
jgi:hypothetical protein